MSVVEISIGDDEIMAQIQEIEAHSEALEFENDMFEKFLRRVMRQVLTFR